MFENKNPWKVIEDVNEQEEDEKEQRSKDMKEMEKKFDEEYPKTPLGNYSNNSMKKAKFQPVKSKDAKPLGLHHLELCKEKDVAEEKRELYPAITSDNGGWQWIKGVVDSGASESVAHPAMCPQYPVTPSAGSIAGHSYTSASGDAIPNLGEQVLHVTTEDGRDAQVKYQSADVSRALNSVSEICDGGGASGQYVLFNKWGGEILNPETGRRVPFQREEGIYTMGMWVHPKSNGQSGFTMPGQ